MSKAISVFSILFFIIAIPNQALSEEHPELNRFCMWKASAAQVIAMNRDIGLDEIKITAQYLKQEADYNEQLIVLGLIDRIYGTYEFVTHDTIYSQTKKTCLRDFYIDKTQEVFLSQNTGK